MSATVGAALKKNAVALLSNKKVAKNVIVFLLAVIVVVLFPIVAVVSLIPNNVQVDYHELQNAVVSNMSAEQ